MTRGPGIVGLVVVWLAAEAANAQEAPAPAPAPAAEARGPLWIGFTVGGGVIETTCPDCGLHVGAAADAHVGWMVLPRLGVALEISGIESQVEDSLFIHASLDVVARLWATPHLWFEGGAGVGRLALSDAEGIPYLRSDRAPSSVAAVGWSVFVSPRFVFDVLARGTMTFFDDPAYNVAVSIGFDWWFDPALAVSSAR
jgi:hypothetical protein